MILEKLNLDNRKKILFTLPNLIGGGAERVLVNIINQVDLKKYKIFLLLLNKQGPLFSCLNNEIDVIDLKIKRTRYSLFKIVKIINKINPNIVFSTTQRMNLIVLIASLFFKRNLKVFVREANMPSLLIKNRELSKIKFILVKILYKYAYKVIAQTDEMKKDLVKVYNLPQKKIHTIYNPLDYDYINKSANIGEDPFNHNYINIVASGRIINQKAYDVLIKAFKIVIEKNSKFRLYVLGDDVIGLKQELLELIKKLKLESFIFFEGFIENPYSYYKYSDLYVLSSRWEGLPNTVLENLYLEKPIVATNCIEYLSEIIIDNQNGYIVAVDDYRALSKKILNYDKLNPKNTYIPTDINVFLNKYI